MAALEGRGDADKLVADERELFDELIQDALMTPSAEAVQFAKTIRTKAGAVGFDDTGRWVRNLPGGGVKVLQEADDSGKGRRCQSQCQLSIPVRLTACTSNR